MEARIFAFKPYPVQYSFGWVAGITMNDKPLPGWDVIWCPINLYPHTNEANARRAAKKYINKARKNFLSLLRTGEYPNWEHDLRLDAPLEWAKLMQERAEARKLLEGE